MAGGGGMHGRGACMAGGSMHVGGGGYAWQGHVWHGGHAWQGGVFGRVCVAGDVLGRRDGHCSSRHASYWNAFLFKMNLKAMSFLVFSLGLPLLLPSSVVFPK